MNDYEKLSAFAEDMAQLLDRHPDVRFEWEADSESEYAYLACGNTRDYLGTGWCLPDTPAQWRELARNLKDAGCKS